MSIAVKALLFTHSLAPLIYVYVWRWLAVVVSWGFSFAFPLPPCSAFSNAEIVIHGQGVICKPWFPLESVMILSLYHIMGRTSALVRLKSGSKNMPLFNHEIVITSPSLPFTNGLAQTFPFYVGHMLLLKLIANYHGLNDLTPPPSLQMIILHLSPFQ